ncbi:MAG: FHA domain-containing protein [Muribaculaceae bacterium]
METKIIITVECPYCKSAYGIQKRKGQKQCKFACPKCKKPLHMVFDIQSDPQTYVFAPENEGEQQNTVTSKNNGSNITEDVNENNNASEPKERKQEKPKDPKETVHYNAVNNKKLFRGDYIPGEEEEQEVQTPKKKYAVLRDNLYLVRKKFLGFVTEKYRLKQGKNIVGRYDTETPSDISIQGDETISRRSIEIEIVADGYGFDYILKVLNATNPVKLNGKCLKTGEKVSLSFGDVIVLGNTSLTFEKQ